MINIASLKYLPWSEKDIFFYLIFNVKKYSGIYKKNRNRMFNFQTSKGKQRMTKM